MNELAKNIEPLSQLNIHLGEGCSLSCRPCKRNHNPAVDGQLGIRLLSGLAVQAVREALPLGLLGVRLTGRGVLLYPELDALLDRLEKLELNVAVETDGAGITAATSQRLARLPQSSVWILLDGADAVTHDGIHGRPGAFDIATRAIRALAQAGLPAQVVCTVRRRNAGQLADIIRLVDELGGASIVFSMLQPGKIKPRQTGSIGSHPELTPGNGARGSGQVGDLQVEELIALAWRIERELAVHCRLKLLFDLPPVFRGLHPQSASGGPGPAYQAWQKRCGILNGVSITAAGEYALCGLAQGVPNFILGQAGADSLELIWTHHPILQVLRQGMPDRLEGVCQRCKLKNACMGFCAVENYLQSGSFWSPNWFCQSAEQVGLFPAGRLIENYW